jgi:hypothetical protein
VEEYQKNHKNGDKNRVAYSIRTTKHATKPTHKDKTQKLNTLCRKQETAYKASHANKK